MAKEKQLPLLSAGGRTNCDGTYNIPDIFLYWDVSIPNDIYINHDSDSDTENYEGRELSRKDNGTDGNELRRSYNILMETMR